MSIASLREGGAFVARVESTSRAFREERFHGCRRNMVSENGFQ